jgi:hypothetical protein
VLGLAYLSRTEKLIFMILKIDNAKIPWKILIEAEVICEPMNIGYLLVYVIFVSYGKCDPNLCEPKKIDSHSSQISH